MMLWQRRKIWLRTRGGQARRLDVEVQSPIPNPSLMRVCVQRVRHASVSVAGEVCGRIGPGMLVLLGVAADDTEADARWLAQKTAGLRIFEDSQQKMNLSLADVSGAMLVVSQFTLLGDCRRGRRPDFTAAAPPETAEKLYQVFVDTVAQQGIAVATGRFRQQMEVELVNDGPVTLVVESKEGRGARGEGRGEIA
jgi:D-aminoacyl-tRNA deacylase